MKLYLQKSQKLDDNLQIQSKSDNYIYNKHNAIVTMGYRFKKVILLSSESRLYDTCSYNITMYV